MLHFLFVKIRSVPKIQLLIYVLLYFFWGLGMHWFGQQVEIAKFTYWWQVITCYVFYMVPISIFIKDESFFTQYAYGLVAMGLLEFAGYALGTSYIYPDNIIDKMFGEHVFALGMSLFFAFYFPVGNWAVHRIYNTFNRK